MGGNSLISVVVPVYNTEKFLRRCLDSILAQTYPSIEMILVDDGSADRSGRICDEYARKYENVKVIHKTNSGSIGARKEGVRCAKGEYVGFVDSDDWIAPQMYENLFTVMRNENADLAVTNCIEENGGSIWECRAERKGGICSEEGIVSLLHDTFSTYHNGSMVSMCNKLYKKSRALRVMSRIDERIRYGEDALFNFIYLLDCERVYFSESASYHYVKNLNSVCHSKYDNFLESTDQLYKSALEAIKEHPKFCELKISLDKYISKLLCAGINRFMGLEEQAHIPFYVLSPDILEKEKKRIVLYGAGRVGREFYGQIQNSEKMRLVLWVDKEAEEIKDTCEKIRPVSQIKRVEYDYVIVAVKAEEIAMDIAEHLVRDYGVQRNKICWSKPVSIL